MITCNHNLTCHLRYKNGVKIDFWVQCYIILKRLAKHISNVSIYYFYIYTQSPRFVFIQRVKKFLKPEQHFIAACTAGERNCGWALRLGYVTCTPCSLFLLGLDWCQQFSLYPWLKNFRCWIQPSALSL